MTFSLVGNLASLAQSVSRSLMGKRVTITGDGHSCVLDAAMGRTRGMVQTADVVELVYNDVDWIIQSADLVMAGERAVPKRGWKVIVTDPRETLTYQVQPPGGAEDCYQYCDPDRATMRIHTKLVAKGT